MSSNIVPLNNYFHFLSSSISSNSCFKRPQECDARITAIAGIVFMASVFFTLSKFRPGSPKSSAPLQEKKERALTQVVDTPSSELRRASPEGTIPITGSLLEGSNTQQVQQEPIRGSGGYLPGMLGRFVYNLGNAATPVEMLVLHIPAACVASATVACFINPVTVTAHVAVSVGAIALSGSTRVKIVDKLPIISHIRLAADKQGLNFTRLLPEKVGKFLDLPGRKEPVGGTSSS